MGLARTMLAAMIALSVALLPVAGGAVAGLNTVDVSVSVPMHDCCEHGAMPCDKTQKAADDCMSAAACALKCFNFFGIASSRMLIAQAESAIEPVRVSQLVGSQTGCPPFRPPRV